MDVKEDAFARLQHLEESVHKINNSMKSFASEVEAIKNNLQLISEIINKFVTESREMSNNNKFKVFGKFVEESLGTMVDGEAEGAVLEIVEILHKHKINCEV